MKRPYAGRKSIATAYSPECLYEDGASFATQQIELHAPESNTSVIYIGDRSVCARADYEVGLPLDPGDRFTLVTVDLADWFLDVRTDGDAVSYLVIYDDEG